MPLDFDTIFFFFNSIYDNELALSNVNERLKAERRRSEIRSQRRFVLKNRHRISNNNVKTFGEIRRIFKSYGKKCHLSQSSKSLFAECYTKVTFSILKV